MKGHKIIEANNKKEYYTLYYTLLNILLPKKLTKPEILFVLTAIRINAAERLDNAARKKIKDMLGLSSSSMSTRISQLVDKGIIYNGNNQVRTYAVYKFREILLPDSDIFQNFNITIKRLENK